MLVKPVTFVGAAALVVVGAGAGAYLALNDSSSSSETSQVADLDPYEPYDSARSETDAPETAVEATEEVIGPEPGDEPVDVASPDPHPPSRPAAQSTTHPDAAGVNATTVQPDPPAPPPAPAGEPSAETGTGSADPPVVSDRNRVAGWERRPSPAPPLETEPDRIALRSIDRTTIGNIVAPEAPPPVIRELVVPADSVIGLQVDTPVSTEDAKVEDDVQARVTRDVVVSDEVAVPAGTRVMGSVVLVEGAGQLKGSARLGVRFHTIVLDDVYEVPIVTETVYREGKGRGGESAAKIGGAAVGGAILGAIFGGRQGAAIGGAAGAAGGTAAAMAGDGQPATLPAGSTLTVRLSRPATVTLDY